jgi:AsnC-type helix-turn-helix domain
VPRADESFALDTIDRKIIEVLLTDARISIKELAENVELSPPSVSTWVESPSIACCRPLYRLALGHDPACPETRIELPLTNYLR